MKKENLVSGALVVLFGIYVFWTATNFGLKGLSPDPLGPAFFPKVLGIGLIGLGLLLMLIAIQKNEEVVEEEQEKQEQKGQFLTKGNTKILLIIALGILYVYLLLKIGFVLDTLIFILAVMFITGERLWWKIAVSSLTISFGLFFLFKYVLKVMLPLGFGL